MKTTADKRNHSLQRLRGNLGWFAALVVSLTAACGGDASSRKRMGGESHFLVHCIDGDSCGVGLDCIGGVCTLSCSAGGGICSELSPLASCAFQSSEPDDRAACDVACSEDATCTALGARHRCESGSCRAPGGVLGEAGGVSGIPSLGCGTITEIGTQAEVNALEGCERLSSLTIYVSTQLDLRSLYGLREVSGGLSLVGDYPEQWSPLMGIPSLEGLEGLERVGGLSLSSLPVSSLRPLERLRMSEGMALSIEECDNLESLAGLNLSGYFDQIRISGNDRLTSLEPLRYVAAPPSRPTIELWDNPKLTDLQAIAGLTDVFRLRIVAMPLQTLDLFKDLRVAAYDIRIVENQALVDASLPSLEVVQILDIYGNAALATAPELTRLRSLQRMELSDNPELLNAPRFPSLIGTEPDNANGPEIRVMNNSKLQRLDGFPVLSAASGIHIVDNPSLTSVDLGTLTQINIPLMGALVSYGDPGGLMVQGNASLVSLDADQLGTISGPLTITFNPLLPQSSLERLSGLVGATHVKIGGNQGSTLLAPCPWVDDSTCDEPPTSSLCADGTDVNDCYGYP
jgi:hypothetical protein